MKAIIITSILMLTASVLNAQAVKVDKDLDTYKAVSGVSGTLNSVGSDTLNNLMANWSSAFKKIYPNVKIEVEGKGSSTAPPALIEGISQLGPMSREMKSSELDKFEQKFGYKPTLVKVSIDALAVFVHKDNPIKGLSLEQVDSIFSKTYNFGGKNITKWGQLGLKGDWADKPISIYGRNSASGTYGYFKKVTLKKGDYKETVKEQPGSSAVIQGVGTDLGSIGYSGIGYKTSEVRALPISEKGTRYKEPNMDNCLSGDYPIARFLNIYINKKPSKKVDTLTYEFLRFVLSKQGQEIVVEDGYFPVPASVAKTTLKEISKN